MLPLHLKPSIETITDAIGRKASIQLKSERFKIHVRKMLMRFCNEGYQILILYNTIDAQIRMNECERFVNSALLFEHLHYKKMNSTETIFVVFDLE